MQSLKLFALGSLLVVCSAARAWPADSDKSSEVMKRMCDFYQGLKSFEVSSEMKVEINAQGRQQKLAGTTRYVFERPNRLAMSADGKLMPVMIVSDGKRCSPIWPP